MLHYTGMRDADAALELLTRARQRSLVRIISCSKTAGSFRWSRKAAAPGTPANRHGPARPTSIPARSASRSPIPATIMAIRDFPKRQIAAVTALCRSILTRNTIAPVRVLAHSDVAPARKQDPGRKISVAHAVRFRRRPLGETGADHEFRPGACARATAVTRSPRCRNRFGEYGYGLAVNGEYDTATRDVVTAFQRHFRPERDRRHRRSVDAQHACRNCWPIAAAREPWPPAPAPPCWRAAPVAMSRLWRPPLTAAADTPIPVRQSAGRPLRRNRKVAGEESPGSMDKRCRITSGGCEPRESATENRPPRRVAFSRGKGETVR